MSAWQVQGASFRDESGMQSQRPGLPSARQWAGPVPDKAPLPTEVRPQKAFPLGTPETSREAQRPEQVPETGARSRWLCLGRQPPLPSPRGWDLGEAHWQAPPWEERPEQRTQPTSGFPGAAWDTGFCPPAPGTGMLWVPLRTPESPGLWKEEALPPLQTRPVGARASSSGGSPALGVWGLPPWLGACPGAARSGAWGLQRREGPGRAERGPAAPEGPHIPGKHPALQLGRPPEAERRCKHNRSNKTHTKKQDNEVTKLIPRTAPKEMETYGLSTKNSK